MKENNYIEQFDELFRQQLGNASAPVPPGVWESISSSVGSSAGVAATAAKPALWMKAVITVSVIGVVSAVTYGVLSQKQPEAVVKPAAVEKSAVETVIIPDTKPQALPETTATPAAPPSREQQIAAGKEQVPNSRKGNTKKDNKLQDWNGVYLSDTKDQKHPKINFYEEKDEVSNTYLSKMNDNVVPGFDSAKMAKQEVEQTEEIPYVPETEPLTRLIDSSFIYIPNVVTPNGDGVNDEYLIDIKGEEFVQIIVYNSRSVKVFETKNKNTAWDCKMPNGEIAPEGDYLVKVIYKFRNKSKNTSVTKLRLIK